MKWNLNKKVSIGFGIAFIVLVAVGTISYYSLNSFREIRRSERKTRQILTELENVNSYFKDIDNSQHGFVITGEESYLDPFYNAKVLLNDELDLLEADLKNKGKIQKLKTLIARKIVLAEAVIKKRKSEGEDSAFAAIVSGEGKKVSDEIRKLILQFKIEATKLKDLQSTEGDTNAGYALLFIIFGNLIALSVLLVAVNLLNQDIGKRIRTEIVLNRFIQKAEQAQKKEEQFLANMSHEIRTPMNAIIGMTNLILNTPLQPKQQSYLKAIKQSSENLMVIINEILDFSKITAGKIEFEQVNFNLSDIFYGLYNTFKIKADEKNIKINPIIDENLPDTIKGDPGKLTQVLINLIGNSIKFTQTGKIDIQCRLVEQTGDDLLIEFAVKDTGIGIPEDKLSSIFEDFTQASTDTSRKFGGTGLGLSISKKIVELQGGKISVQSRLGTGTTFTINLRFKVGTEKLEKKEKNVKAKAQELHGLKILLVEDNEFNQVVAVDTLNTLIKNLTIDVAANGKLALEKLSVNKDYDIILMDVQMPELNGYETSEYIRKDRKLGYTEIPIIAMTASATRPEIQKCFDSGMTDFVSKPFDADILLIKISALINKERLEVEPVTVNSNSDAGGILTGEGADLSFLKSMTGGNKENMLKYINMFLDSVPTDWDRLKIKSQENNWAEVRVIAHSMKPRISYMGIKKGGEIIKEIENFAAEEKNLDKIPELIVKFENILYITYKQLESEKQSL